MSVPLPHRPAQPRQPPKPERSAADVPTSPRRQVPVIDYALSWTVQRNGHDIDEGTWDWHFRWVDPEEAGSD